MVSSRIFITLFINNLILHHQPWSTNSYLLSFYSPTSEMSTLSILLNNLTRNLSGNPIVPKMMSSVGKDNSELKSSVKKATLIAGNTSFMSSLAKWLISNVGNKIFPTSLVTGMIPNAGNNSCPDSLATWLISLVGKSKWCKWQEMLLIKSSKNLMT